MVDRWLVIVAFVLVILSLILIFLYSLAETSLVAVNRGRLRVLVRSLKVQAGSAIFHFVDDRQALSSLVTGTTLMILVSASLTTLVMEELAPVWSEGVGIALALFIVIFCEVLPKTIGVSHPEVLIVRGWRFWSLLSALMRPITSLIYWIAQFVLRTVADTDSRHNIVSEEDLMTLLEAAQQEGVVEPEEYVIARRILKLDQILVRDIMVAAPDIVALPASASLDEAVTVIMETGHSRIPLYEGSLDNLVGVVYAMDLLNALAQRIRPASVQELARRVTFVPETKPVSELLNEMRTHQVQIAIALDEHGATAGLVTLEDIVEEIVGELRDEHDRERELLVQLDSRTFLVDARMDRRQFEEQTGISLPEGEFATVGGFVFNQIGRLPAPGEKVVTPQALFIVEEVQKRRLSRLRVLIRSPES
ncbi:MAG: hemolysin family protein [Armatimonadetes bacterium]|nr:hemolysin family protein [Armatimonadota bacterium]MDW8120825.1 hemolysin family protein [Armatimonadota bacterium]